MDTYECSTSEGKGCSNVALDGENFFFQPSLNKKIWKALSKTSRDFLRRFVYKMEIADITPKDTEDFLNWLDQEKISINIPIYMSGEFKDFNGEPILARLVCVTNLEEKEKIAEMLISRGADVNYINNQDVPLLQETIELLYLYDDIAHSSYVDKEYGEDGDIDEYERFYNESEKQMKIIELLLKNGARDFNSVDKERFKSLVTIVSLYEINMFSLKLIKLLLEYGFNPNQVVYNNKFNFIDKKLARCEDGISLLLFLYKNNYRVINNDIIILLLQFGVDPEEILPLLSEEMSSSHRRFGIEEISFFLEKEHPNIGVIVQ